MRSTGLTKSFLFLLIMAFLMLQWSSSHIHLSQQHDHGQGQHDHSVQLHAHQEGSQHLDAIDVADNNHHSGDTAVLELDYNCTCSVTENLAKLPSLVFAFYTSILSLSPLQAIAVFDRVESPPGYLERHPLGQRGPPQLA